MLEEATAWFIPYGPEGAVHARARRVFAPRTLPVWPVVNATKPGRQRRNAAFAELLRVWLTLATPDRAALRIAEAQRACAVQHLDSDEGGRPLHGHARSAHGE